MKVWENKKSKQKYITIPKDSDIVEGDYVEIKKINNGENNFEVNCPKCSVVNRYDNTDKEIGVIECTGCHSKITLKNENKD